MTELRRFPACLPYLSSLPTEYLRWMWNCAREEQEDDGAQTPPIVLRGRQRSRWEGWNYLEGREHPEFPVNKPGPMEALFRVSVQLARSMVWPLYCVGGSGFCNICNATKTHRELHSSIRAHGFTPLQLSSPSLSNKPFSALRSPGCLYQQLKQPRLGLSAVATSLRTWRTLSWQSLPPDQVPDGHL
jgi:hypothetical protein